MFDLEIFYELMSGVFQIKIYNVFCFCTKNAMDFVFKLQPKSFVQQKMISERKNISQRKDIDNNNSNTLNYVFL